MRAAYPRIAGYASNPSDGVQLFYESFGPPDATRTILFLPTWTIVDRRMWKAQVPYFSRHGFRVVTFDNRGNGRSGRPSSAYSVERIGEDALSVLDAVGVSQVALVGLSAISRWGIKLAAEHPERITHLALIGPSVWLGQRTARAQMFYEKREHYTAGTCAAHPSGGRITRRSWISLLGKFTPSLTPPGRSRTL